MAIRRRRKPNQNRKQAPKYNINGEINHPEVRVVGENIEQGVYSTKMAIQLAEEQGLDLVENFTKSNTTSFVEWSIIRNFYTSGKRKRRNSKPKPKRLWLRKFDSPRIQMITILNLS